MLRSGLLAVIISVLPACSDARTTFELTQGCEGIRLELAQTGWERQPDTSLGTAKLLEWRRPLPSGGEERWQTTNSGSKLLPPVLGFRSCGSSKRSCPWCHLLAGT